MTVTLPRVFLVALCTLPNYVVAWLWVSYKTLECKVQEGRT